MFVEQFAHKIRGRWRGSKGLPWEPQSGPVERPGHPALTLGGYLARRLSEPGFKSAYIDSARHGEILKELSEARAQAGLTNEAVAQASGLPMRSVEDISRGGDPTLLTVFRYARAINKRVVFELKDPQDADVLSREGRVLGRLPSGDRNQDNGTQEPKGPGEDSTVTK